MFVKNFSKGMGIAIGVTAVTVMASIITSMGST
jgi:hypothetical protein